MWFTDFAFKMCLNFRPDGATKGKWKIPDEKSESGLFSCSEPRWW
jgi:hypothetical protein